MFLFCFHGVSRTLAQRYKENEWIDPKGNTKRSTKWTLSLTFSLFSWIRCSFFGPLHSTPRASFTRLPSSATKRSIWIINRPSMTAVCQCQISVSKTARLSFVLPTANINSEGCTYSWSDRTIEQFVMTVDKKSEHASQKTAPSHHHCLTRESLQTPRE